MKYFSSLASLGKLWPMVAFFCLLSTLSFSQEKSNNEEAKGAVGLKFGINVSHIVTGEFSNKYKTEPLAGLDAGITFLLPLNDKNLFFRPELIYSQEGGKVDYYLKSRNTEHRLTGVKRVDYLILPLLLDLTVHQKNRSIIAINAGVFAAFGVGGYVILKNDQDNFLSRDISQVEYNMQIRFRDYINPNIKPYTDDVMIEYGFVKPYDLGLKFGASYKISRMMIDLNCSYGLENIRPMEYKTENIYPEKYSRSYHLNMVYYINKFKPFFRPSL